jgi:hypothetical protein
VLAIFAILANQGYTLHRTGPDLSIAEELRAAQVEVDWSMAQMGYIAKYTDITS